MSIPDNKKPKIDTVYEVATLWFLAWNQITSLDILLIKTMDYLMTLFVSKDIYLYILNMRLDIYKEKAASYGESPVYDNIVCWNVRKTLMRSYLKNNLCIIVIGL